VAYRSCRVRCLRSQVGVKTPAATAPGIGRGHPRRLAASNVRLIRPRGFTNASTPWGPTGPDFTRRPHLSRRPTSGLGSATHDLVAGRARRFRPLSDPHDPTMPVFKPNLAPGRYPTPFRTPLNSLQSRVRPAVLPRVSGTKAPRGPLAFSLARRVLPVSRRAIPAGPAGCLSCQHLRRQAAQP
jgi:hypothetical protein